MSRRMSCALTLDAVKDRTKDVTRRDSATWRGLKPGDRVTLVAKGMGLKKGEKQEILADVEIVSNRVEWLDAIDQDEVIREGFSDKTPSEFIEFWLRSHGMEWHALRCITEVRRIEWRYLD